MKRGDRLRLIREYRGLSQDQLAALVGCSQGSITKLENDKAEGSQFLYQISKILNAEMEWIESGGGRDPRIAADISIPNGKVPVIAWNAVKTWVNTFDLDSSHESLVINENSAAYITEFISIPEKKNDKQFSLKIKDEDMISHIPGHKTFLKGEIIVIDPEVKAVNGSYVIASIEGSIEAEPILRQYIFDGENYCLMALNPNFKKIETVGKKVNICGVVVAHLDVLV